MEFKLLNNYYDYYKSFWLKVENDVDEKLGAMKKKE